MIHSKNGLVGTYSWPLNWILCWEDYSVGIRR
ncbi:Protein of unknown function [Pyronema omphalodes CBS 100304]|uniref:Uncharacterized protein n=1 Tax=Pyronema omphalodes (strain CBS 100304) TaxID=1076935 RepID=U4L609_PYROM|nr:Protein of unknown function [Pyronema omphalodes CBS 100304]